MVYFRQKRVTEERQDINLAEEKGLLRNEMATEDEGKATKATNNGKTSFHLFRFALTSKIYKSNYRI